MNLFIFSFQWHDDVGFIQDNNKLPVIQVFLGSTDTLGQEGYFFLGPLECEGYSSSDELIYCNSLDEQTYFKCSSG